MDTSPAGGGGGGDPATPNKYACARCGRSYLHQATLVRHQRYECGITASYPCALCGRKFKRRDVLKGHMEKCVNKSVAAAALAQQPQLQQLQEQQPQQQQAAATALPRLPQLVTLLSQGSVPFKLEECGVNCCMSTVQVP